MSLSYFYVIQNRLSVVERGIESELNLLLMHLEHQQKVKSARRSLDA